MGSKTRKLRQQAGVAGLRYQAEQRKLEQARQRAERLGSQVAVSSKHPGVRGDSAFPEGRMRTAAEQLRALVAAGPGSIRAAAFEGAKRNLRRQAVRDYVRPAAAADHLFDLIEEHALRRAHESTEPNSQVVDAVWAKAIEDLLRGATPEGLWFSADDASAAAAITQAAPGLTRYEHEIAGAPFPAEPAARALEPGPVLVGDPNRAPAPRLPSGRMSRLHQVLLVSTILGMGGLNRDGER